MAVLTSGSVLAGCSGGDSSGGNNSSEANGSTTSTNEDTPTESSTSTATAEGTASEATAETTDAATDTTGETSTEGETATESATETETQTQTETVTETSTQTSTQTAGTVEIANSEIVEGDMETGIAAEVTNTGDTRLSYIEVQAAFRNEAGDILDTNFTNVVGLESGQTWETYVSYLGDETVADAELEVVDTTAGELAPPPEGVELIEDSLEPPEDEFGSPSVVGRAENGSDSSVDYLQAMVSFVAENGNLLSSGSTNVSDLPSGETWRFEVEYLAISPNKPDEPSEYTVTLTTSIQ